MRTRRTSVKAFIVDSRNHVLILKRALNDPERPYFFEIPGGRLNPHEDIFIGLRREIKEETGLDIEPLFPLSVRHFTRKDGEVISLLSFVCTP